MAKASWRIFLIVYGLNILLLAISFFIPGSTLMALVFCVWFDGAVYALGNLHKRGALLGFLLSFFLLLIGAEFLERFGLHEAENSFGEALNLHAEFLVLLSLITLFLGYYLSGKYVIAGLENKKKDQSYYHSEKVMIVQKISVIVFFLTFAFNIFTVLDIVLYVMRNGYILFYTSYVSSVPYVIKKLGDMCLVCFWIFLATMPKKKMVEKLSVFYLLYLLLTLGTGKRFPFVAGVLTLFIYFIARNRINSGGEVWIKRKTLVTLAIAVPLGIWGLYMLGEVRFGRLLEGLRLDKALADFLYDQGGTINVIKRAELYADSLPNRSYLFGSTFEAISNNILFRLLGANQYAGNTLEHATEGYSFQHALSYVAMGDYYLSGHGLGSCYIAEAYHDLGYAGVILVNFIYGIFFRKLFDFGRHGIWATTIILSMLYSMLLSPRGSADGFITNIVDLTTWGTILLVWAISKISLSGTQPANTDELVNRT